MFCRICVVDEASMIPVHMAPRVLQRAGKQLIICGDPAQLPAVTHNEAYSESIMGQLMREGMPFEMLKVSIILVP